MSTSVNTGWTAGARGWLLRAILAALADTRTARRQARRPDSRSTARPGARTVPTVLAAAVIVLATLAAYANSMDGIFVFDDEPSIERNELIAALPDVTTALSAPKDSTLAGRPIATLSFALDYARAGGHSLAAYHVTNLAIHVLSALLLFGVVRRTLQSSRLRDRFATAATPLAASVALLWALHPVQTGSVTYIVQRVESLMGLFYLATMYCAIRAAGASRVVPWIAGAVAACALGMGTKEVMVTAPLMVLLWDWTFESEKIRARRPVYAALACTWVILGVLVSGGPRTFSVGFGFEGWPWWRYLLTQAGVVTHYVRLVFVPWPLVLDYEWAPSTFVAAILPGLFVIALLGATAWALLRRMPAGFAGAWFFLILAPTSSILPIVTEVAAEHRLYLPLAGPIALVVVGVYRMLADFRLKPEATRSPQESSGGSRLQPEVSNSSRGFRLQPEVIALVITATLFGTLTHARNADYANYDRIWSKTIEARPRNTRALNNYATSLMAQRRFDEAEHLLRTAVDVKPDFGEGHANLGVALCSQGKYTEGIDHLRRSAALDPERAATFRNLAEAYGSIGQLRDAFDNYGRALALLPDDVGLLNRAAWILATTRDDGLRDGARARELAERAVQLTNRNDAESLDSLAAARAELSDFDGAIAAETEAIAVARASRDTALLTEMEYRLSLYRNGSKFRDSM